MKLERFEKRFMLKPKELTKLYRLISEIDAVKNQWHLAQSLTPQMVQRLQTSVIITSAGASTRIEGSQLSDAEVKELYNKHRITSFKSRDEQEVGGYLDVLELVFDDPFAIEFSESSIRALHAKVLDYSNKDQHHKGGYKLASNRVEARDAAGKIIGIIFDPTEPYLVPKEMSELVAWTVFAFEEGEYPPLLIIANFLFEFLAIHPFSDGNGRLSRILTNLLLLQQDYAFAPFISHERIVEANKADYYLALNQAQRSWKSEQEDLSSWFTFFLQVVSEQASQALTLLSTKPTELFLTVSQQAILNYATSSQEFSRLDLMNALSMKRSTADYSLRRLVAMDKLERIGLGRATRYLLK